MVPLPFGVPEVQDNPDGWGPSTVPDHLKDVPFAPFNKSDKIGRAADWTQSAYHNKFPGDGSISYLSLLHGCRVGCLRQSHLVVRLDGCIW